MGEITGDYSCNKVIGKNVWRVNDDGQARDTFGKLQYVFEMSEEYFLESYNNKIKSKKADVSYFSLWKEHLEKLRKNLPELPFSNIWIASVLHKEMPKDSVIHFAILNSLRSWNFFEVDSTIETVSNVGGFGIDGCVSSLIGASLVEPKKLFFGVVGDLAFFYDLNSIANRNVGNNLRILLINNGKGMEFRNFDNAGAMFGESTDEFIAAGGHNGNKSKTLVKGYSESLGFEYITASNKEEFKKVYKRFIEKDLTEKPIIFEVFTETEDENGALESITSIVSTTKGNAKQVIKNMVGQKTFRALKKVAQGK
jgi:2-succinyl-5-enolpyruvyl-6-hydroxy-3-cyclohexene-1-carboxylate synthase